jgi:hypothetical protein
MVMTDKSPLDMERERILPWHDATWQGRPTYDELRAENEQWRTDWLSMQAENERLRLLLLGMVRGNEEVAAHVQHLTSDWFPYGADDREIAATCSTDKDAC